MNRFLSQSRYPLIPGLVVTATIFSPVGAWGLEAQVSPSQAVLGDTLSVTITVVSPAGQAPMLQFGNKTYPAFPLADSRWRALIPTTPLDSPGRKTLTISDGETTRNLLVWVGNRSFPVQRIWLPPGKDNEGTALEFDQVDAFKALVTPEKLWQGRFVRPNAGPITTGYGVRRYYNGVFAEDYFHRGLDYAGPTGSPVVAAARGRVALVGREKDGFLIHGNVIGLDHGQGVLTIYLHLSQIRVNVGDLVNPGQVIGAVGSSGASTGPHLHWGLYVAGQSVDPRSWLTQGWD
ncbi:M23 family metallopeptidase [Thermosynechococcaceae cyanobacterium BACA0444]|uniref:M23 family metallopeptidase n=1 Tax=Pseudocalidococcus azoricus BACA0444 TaxID=2918990 RepID=A0AAE4JW31_9CYAN|nr:M23 family metallopeptidase [Pseudocalidococcus azoricus]MDS3860955.1 M23 family metallopeptidase [Pseudocalidococcus azoricus BACA0444]